jgi:hypothetical protein
MSFYTIKYYLPNKYNPERWEIYKKINHDFGKLDLYKVHSFYHNGENYWEITVNRNYVVDALNTAMEHFMDMFKNLKLEDKY